MRGGVGRGPPLHMQVPHFGVHLKSDRTASVEGLMGLEIFVAYCAVEPGRGAAQRGRFSCRSRPLPAARPSVSPAPGSTPQRS